jgi:hypothetical protein
MGEVKKINVSAKVDPGVVEAVRAMGGSSFSQAVEDGLRLWLDLHEKPKPKRKARRKVPA